MNKMYNYLEEHSYISKNKHLNYQFELTKERAECIANKYDNLINELQQENLKYEEVFNKLKRYIDGCLELSPIEDRNITDDVLDKELKYLLKIMKEVSE